MRRALVVATLISGGASAACGTVTAPSVQQGPSPAVSSTAPSPTAPASSSPEASTPSEVVTVQATCPGHCVDITFELTVVAAPPAGESLSLDVRIPGQQQHAVTLCGDTGSRRCAGDATVYRVVFSNVPAAGSASYSFDEVSPPAQVTTIRRGTVDLATSSTVSANYPTGP